LLNKHKELHIEYLIQKGKQNTNNFTINIRRG
jgi:hypothetical protein